MVRQLLKFPNIFTNIYFCQTFICIIYLLFFFVNMQLEFCKYYNVYIGYIMMHAISNNAVARLILLMQLHLLEMKNQFVFPTLHLAL